MLAEGEAVQARLEAQSSSLATSEQCLRVNRIALPIQILTEAARPSLGFRVSPFLLLGVLELGFGRFQG